MAAGPSDLERFFAYVRAFEQAYWSDDWSLLAPHWREDGVHRVHGAAPLGADDRGAAAAIAGLRASVHGMDRRFDLRLPEIVAGPSLRDGGVWMRFALTLRRAGLPELRFEGDHLVRFAEGRIALVEERVEPGAGERVSAYLAEHHARLRPAGSAPAPPGEPRDARDLEAAVAIALARSYGAAKSAQDVGAALALCSEDFVLETPSLGLATRDRKEAEQQLALFFTAFPDYRVTLEGLAAGAGAVVAWGRARLTWRGPFAGLEPSGRRAELPFASVFPAAGGQLRGERFLFDLASLCEQLELPLADLRERLAGLRGAG
jgi:hypothetical protein